MRDNLSKGIECRALQMLDSQSAVSLTMWCSVDNGCANFSLLTCWLTSATREGSQHTWACVVQSCLVNLIRREADSRRFRTTLQRALIVSNCHSWGGAVLDIDPLAAYTISLLFRSGSLTVSELDWGGLFSEHSESDFPASIQWSPFAMKWMRCIVLCMTNSDC